MNKKNILALFLSSFALLPIARYIYTFFSDNLVILAYHRIYDIGNEDSFPFDPELISATPLEFEIQMQHIKKHFNPVTLLDVINHHKGIKKLPTRPVVITFDDGHSDNYTNAFPILRSLNMPATIFLSTKYIGSKEIFWFDWVAHAIYKTKVDSLSLNKNDFCINIDKSVLSRRLSTKRTLRYLMTLENDIRILCLDEIKEQLKIRTSEEDLMKSLPLNWNQVSEMSNNDIEFGSHTVTHPILSKLNNHDIAFEIKQSKFEIESHINQSVDTIAYPVGGKNEFNKIVIDESKKAGYYFGVSYISGVETLPIKNLFSIKRLHVERYTNIKLFKAMLALPNIFK